MKRNTRITALLLAFVLLAGLLTACTQKQVETGLDIASALLESLPDSSEAPQSTAAPAAESKPAAAATPAPSAAPTPAPTAAPTPAPTEEPAPVLDPDGTYTTKEDVALYIYTYGHLPGNFITKKEAEAAGWPGGKLEPYCPGKCIGGDRFGNREGLLPSAKGRTWTECDINTLGAKSRGAERIVFSNDGLIYYTGDHYEHFELLYGTP